MSTYQKKHPGVCRGLWNWIMIYFSRDKKCADTDQYRPNIQVVFSELHAFHCLPYIKILQPWICILQSWIPILQFMVLLSLSLFPSYTVTLTRILLLWKSSLLFCPYLQGSPPLQTHQLCDISKAWYDTGFLSLAVEGVYICQMPSYREQVKSIFT